VRDVLPTSRRSWQRWLYFLANHREVILAFDFFTVATLTFKLVYCFFVIEHGRRRVLPVLQLGNYMVWRSSPPCALQPKVVAYGHHPNSGLMFLLNEAMNRHDRNRSGETNKHRDRIRIGLLPLINLGGGMTPSSE
jgi:hypothetical protein